MNDQLRRVLEAKRAERERLAALPFARKAQFVDDCIQPGDVAVSLNYDCLLEGALDCSAKWTPNGGYGSPFRVPPVGLPDFPRSPTIVLKIHGSANFVIAPDFGAAQSQSIGFVFDEHYFPESAKNVHIGFGGGGGRTYLIAPSYVKVPTVEIAYLMLDALAASSRATTLVVVGCAIRREDSFLAVLLADFLHQTDWESRQIVIVDPAARLIRSRVADFWGVDVSRQLVAVEDRLEAATPYLAQLLSERRTGSV